MSPYLDFDWELPWQNSKTVIWKPTLHYRIKSFGWKYQQEESALGYCGNGAWFTCCLGKRLAGHGGYTGYWYNGYWYIRYWYSGYWYSGFLGQPQTAPARWHHKSPTRFISQTQTVAGVAAHSWVTWLTDDPKHPQYSAALFSQIYYRWGFHPENRGKYRGR